MDGLDDLICILTKKPMEPTVALHVRQPRIITDMIEGIIFFFKNGTSSLHMSSWAVGADTIMLRAAGVMKPSSTALSMNDRSEL